MNDRREEWRQDGEATAMGTTFKDWLAAAYPMEFVQMFHPQAVQSLEEVEQFKKAERKRMRDTFAMAALQCLLNQTESGCQAWSANQVMSPGKLAGEYWAQEAYSIADFMMAEGDKEQA